MIEFKWHVPISTDELRGIFQDVCGWSPPDSFVSILADYNGARVANSAISLKFFETDFGDFLDFNSSNVREVMLSGEVREMFPGYIAFAMDSGGASYNVMKDGSIWWINPDVLYGEQDIHKVADSLQEFLESLVYYDTDDNGNIIVLK